MLAALNAFSVTDEQRVNLNVFARLGPSYPWYHGQVSLTHGCFCIFSNVYLRNLWVSSLLSALFVQIVRGSLDEASNEQQENMAWYKHDVSRQPSVV